MARIISNNPFSKRPSVRKGAGPVYNIVKKPNNNVSNLNKKVVSELSLCSGDYDNLVSYVYEIQTNGNHLSYVDCDYVE